LHKRWYPTTHKRWEEDIRQREDKKQQRNKQRNQQRDDDQEDGDTTQHYIIGSFSKEEDKLLWTQQSKSKKRITNFELSEHVKKTRSQLQIQSRWTRDGFKKYVANNFGDNAYSNLHKR